MAGEVRQAWMGIESERYSIHCDWCGVEPDPGQTFPSHTDAYKEMIRISRHESWFLKYVGSQLILGCPECTADGRFK